jgi:hypothetical protein
VDELVDVGDGDGQADQDVAAVAGLVSSNLVRRTTTSSRNSTKAVTISAGPSAGPAAVQRQHVDPERGLQRREAVELVQDHVGRGVALHLDDDAHALAVALVAQVGDALDPLLAHQFGDALDQAALFSW